MRAAVATASARSRPRRKSSLVDDDGGPDNDAPRPLYTIPSASQDAPNADNSERTASTAASEASNRSPVKGVVNQQDGHKSSYSLSTSLMHLDEEKHYEEGDSDGDCEVSKLGNRDEDSEKGFSTVQTDPISESRHGLDGVIGGRGQKPPKAPSSLFSARMGGRNAATTARRKVTALDESDCHPPDSLRSITALSPEYEHVKTKGKYGPSCPDRFHPSDSLLEVHVEVQNKVSTSKVSTPKVSTSKVSISGLSSFLSPISIVPTSTTLPTSKETKECVTMLSTWLDKGGSESPSSSKAENEGGMSSSSKHDNSSCSLPPLLDYAADSSLAASYSLDSTAASHSLDSTFASLSVGSTCASLALESKSSDDCPLPQEAIVKEYVVSQASTVRRIQSPGGRWSSGGEDSRDWPASPVLPKRDGARNKATNHKSIDTSSHPPSTAPFPQSIRHRRRSLDHISAPRPPIRGKRGDASSVRREPSMERSSSRHSRRGKGRVRSTLDSDDGSTPSASSKSAATHVSPRSDMAGLAEDGSTRLRAPLSGIYNPPEGSNLFSHQSPTRRLLLETEKLTRHHSSSEKLTRRKPAVFNESFFTSTTGRYLRTVSKRKLTWTTATTEAERNFSDWVILITSGWPDNEKVETYHVHKSVVGLGPRSSDLLLEKFDDFHSASTTKESTTALTLPRKAADLVPTMLDYMYAFHGEPMIDVSTATAAALRYLADVFGVQTLFQVVNEFIQNDLNAANAEIYQKDARAFNDEDLLKVAWTLTDHENVEGELPQKNRARH